MNDNQDQPTNNMTFYISVISGALLTISEIMPYVSQIKGNGIIQVLVNAFTKFEEKKKQEEQTTQKKLEEICSHLENLEKRIENIEKNKQ